MGRVYHLNNLIRPGGGPPGYLYNLKNGLNAYSNANSKLVIYATHETTERSYRVTRRNPFKKIAESFINKIYRYKDADLFPSFFLWLLFIVFEKYTWGRPFKASFTNKLSTADSIVCHNVKLGSQVLNANYNTSVWIMPHSPVSYGDEVAELLTEKFGNSFVKQASRAYLNKMELKAYRRARGLISPNATACNSYFLDFPDLKTQFKMLRFEHVLTGAPKLQPTKSVMEVRSELNIDPSSKVIGYFGRYHIHKGFDFFLELANENANPNFKFLCAGAGNLESKIDSSKVENLGWRADIANLISITDVVVIPNEHTYFDLITLEALALGKVVLTSATGGNLWFQDNNSGVILFKKRSTQECLQQINYICTNYSKLSLEARTAYDNYFEIRKFVEGHLRLAERIAQLNE